MRPGGTLGPGANGRAGRRWYALVAYGAPSVIILAVYLNSRLLMNFSHRFFVPFYPLALIGLASLCPTSSGPAGLDPAARRTAESTGARVRHAWQTALPLALLGLQLAYNAVMFFGAEADYVRSYRTLIADEHVPAGQFLHRAVPEDEWVVVHVDAGAIPYYSKRPTIDFGGLTDRFLARTRSLPERVDYAFAHDPAAFVFTSYRWDRVDHGEEADRIVKDPRFRRYRLVRKYRTEAPGLESYYEFVFLREDLVGRVGVPVGISSPGNGLAHLYLGSPSGLYLLRMTTPGQESARKLWITR